MKDVIWNMFLSISSDWGGGIDGDGTAAVQELNNDILKIAAYAGAVIIAIGITQILIAFHEQNPAAKTRAAITTGLGILFLLSSTVLTALGLTNTSGITEQSVAENALEILGIGFQYSGIMLVAIAVVQLVIAMANEDAREKADGTKTLAVGIALYSASALINHIKTDLFSATPSGETIVSKILGIITFFGRYVGIGFAGIGIFHLALAMKDGDGSAKAKSALFVASGAALFALKPLLDKLGITVPY